ncbi:MAG: ABC transporter substrate-binding protein [Defluviitaleaceae bacterium]|nr:ABC transporter substrate-binding protein [Defluviitaleaceae bacterium]
MHKKYNILLFLALVAALTIIFTSCGSQEELPEPPEVIVTPTPEPTTEPAEEDIEEPGEHGAVEDILAQLREMEAQFPITTSNSSEIIPGGTFMWARAQNSPFTGLFHPWLSIDASDSAIGNVLSYPLISINDDMVMTQDGLVTWEICFDELSFTMTMADVEVLWSDGVELTLADVAYAIWFVAHPNYPGTRFNMENHTPLIVGAEEFKQSNPADARGYRYDIEGMVLSDCERILKLYFTAMPPAMQFRGGIISTPLPRHHFEGIPVGETANHIHSRDGFLGFGPFVIDTVVHGESVLLRANPLYWQGAPYLDYIYYRIIPPSMQGEYMRAGMYDMAGMRHVDWLEYSYLNNVEFLGRIGGNQSFIHFNLGARRLCDDTNTIYFVPRYDNHPINNRYVRHAIGYAMNHHELNINLRSSLQRSATTVLHPFNASRWMDPYALGFAENNIARANYILDREGFVWGLDGFRLDQEGNPFHINLGWRINPVVDEIVFNHYQENLREIGIDLRLWEDDFIDHGLLVSRNITSLSSFELSPNDDMHMWQMSWNMDANPDPSVLWGHSSTFNASNFTNDTFQAILGDIGSIEAWDDAFLADAYGRWAVAFDYYLPALYETWPIAIETINHRVANWTLCRSTFGAESFSWARVGLTALEPYAHQ